MSDQEIRVAVTREREAPLERGELDCRDEYLYPAVDIFETRQEITLLADIPGVEANDVEIELNGNSLTVLAKGCDVEGEGARLLSEYSVRSFYRSFSITDVVDTARVSASLIDGVLKIVLPKRDRSIPKRIPISAP